MIHEVFMPALSSTMTEGKIVEWVKAEGDKVEKGETVLIVESDKADMDVESFYEGFLAAIITPAGGMAPVGDAIALIAETEAEIAEAKAKAKSGGGAASPAAAPAAAPAAPVAAAAPEMAPAPAAAPAAPAGRPVASPRARKLAKSLGLDVAAIAGTGPHGRVTAADVEKAAGKAPSVPAPAVAPAAVAAPAPVAAAAPAGAVLAAAVPQPGQLVPLNTLQQAVVRNMNASLEVPVFRVGYTITTDALDKLYKQLKSKGVTMTGLLAKAVGVTLAKHPLVNAKFTEAGIQYQQNVNVAVAVAMDDGGLLTPVLPNADQADLYSLSRTWADLVARARTKQLKPEEYSTGTFTLSNLGMFGVDRFDAILPPGTGAILAVGASRPTVVATADGLIGVKRQMQVNLTCDHRSIYGSHAAAFLKDLADLIENNPQSLTM